MDLDGFTGMKPMTGIAWWRLQLVGGQFVAVIAFEAAMLAMPGGQSKARPLVLGMGMEVDIAKVKLPSWRG